MMLFQCSVYTVVAQPQRSRVQNNRNAKQNATGSKGTTNRNNGSGSISRADLMFPTAVQMPEEVVWRRDLYRELDLTLDANAPLYFPERPIGNQMNLCAVIFKLVGTGKIPIYKYSRADGYEDFSEANRMRYRELLEQCGVKYDSNENPIKISDDQIPCEEIKKYFIKESNYYDQNTATYKSRVVAICPVMLETSEFSFSGGSNKPLCWIKYDDIAPYLNSHIIMTSNVNNAATMSMADFFATNHYKGKIYTTANMQGRALAQEVKPDSITGEITETALKKVQDRIEKEMKDFEKNIWTTPIDSAELARRDSIAKIQNTKKTVSASNTRRGQTSTGNTTVQSSAKKEKTQKSQSAPRVSVRRQRH